MIANKLRGWKKCLLPILYIILVYALFQLLTIVLDSFQIIKMSNDVEPVIDRDILPMVMGNSTDNLLIYAGTSVKFAYLIANFFHLLKNISFVVLIITGIKLSHVMINENSVFSAINLSKIRIAAILYISFPLLECIFDCFIIRSRVSSVSTMIYIVGFLYSFADILFTGLLILFAVSSFQHGINLQHEADETL